MASAAVSTEARPTIPKSHHAAACQELYNTFCEQYRKCSAAVLENKRSQKMSRQVLDAFQPDVVFMEDGSTDLPGISDLDGLKMQHAERQREVLWHLLAQQRPRVTGALAAIAMTRELIKAVKPATPEEQADYDETRKVVEGLRRQSVRLMEMIAHVDYFKYRINKQRFYKAQPDKHSRPKKKSMPEVVVDAPGMFP